MKVYQELLQDIINNGDVEENRTGQDTLSVISRELRWDLSNGFPLLTSKKMATKGIIGELLLFLSGSTDIKDLRKLTNLSDTDFCIWQQNFDEYKARLFDEFAQKYNENYGRLGGGLHRINVNNIPDDPEHIVHRLKKEFYEAVTSMGYMYSEAWRAKRSFDNGEPVLTDQIGNLVSDIIAIRYNPRLSAKRRLLVDAWDAHHHGTNATLLSCALPPCHYGFQCFVRHGKLSLKWNQRSVDTFLGLPFNIASYAALVHILCRFTGLEPGELIFSGGDVHLYMNHIEQAKEQIARQTHDLCEFVMPENLTNLEQLTNMEFTAADFEFKNYKHEPAIKAKMS